MYIVAAAGTATATTVTTYWHVRKKLLGEGPKFLSLIIENCLPRLSIKLTQCAKS